MKIEQQDIDKKAVWGAKELEKAGFSRTMAYQLLNRDDVPTIRFGGRLFVHREKFLEWLAAQTESTK